MSKGRRDRPWTRWVAAGSIAMAVLAVLSLGATVFVAQLALADASSVIVRGEGDVLFNAVLAELAESQGPTAAATLERSLSLHEDQGLRYLAIVDREGMRTFADAGTAELREAGVRPGQSTISGRRVRFTGLLIPPRRHHVHAGGAESSAPPPPPWPPFSTRPPPGGPHMGDRPPGLPVLVVEFEPPVIRKLRGDLTRISVVAAVAGVVLLAFSIAWWRTATRLAAIELRAAREQRLVALGGMSSVMAHELRNPLASLKGHAQLLVEDIDDDKRRAKAERVVSEAERLERLTTSLLDFVRDGPTELAEIDPAALVARSVEHLPDARVALDLAAAPPKLLVDAPRLSRALSNLLDNALQAAPSAEKVELRIERSGTEVAFVVRDRGPGLPAGSESSLFEPFVTTRVRGTGLGLAVVRRVAEQHHGTVTAENHPDGGAVFCLRLPDAARDA